MTANDERRHGTSTAMSALQQGISSAIGTHTSLSADDSWTRRPRARLAYVFPGCANQSFASGVPDAMQ